MERKNNQSHRSNKDTQNKQQRTTDKNFTSKEKKIHEGYAEMGRKGGEVRREQLGHEGYVEMGHKGGEVRKEQMAQDEHNQRGRGSSRSGNEGGKSGSQSGGNNKSTRSR